MPELRMRQCVHGHVVSFPDHTDWERDLTSGCNSSDDDRDGKVSALYFTAYELECTRLIRHILIPPSYFPSPYSNPLSFSCKYSFLFCSLISQSWPAVFVMRLKIISIYLSIYLSSQQTMPYLISTWVARLNTLLAMSGS